MSPCARAGAVLALALAPACLASHTIEHAALPDALVWLREGRTERSEILEQLGQPTWTFEDGRIQTWALSTKWAPRKPRGKGEIDSPPYSLVVVFDAEQHAERVQLVKLW